MTQSAEIFLYDHFSTSRSFQNFKKKKLDKKVFSKIWCNFAELSVENPLCDHRILILNNVFGHMEAVGSQMALIKVVGLLRLWAPYENTICLTRPLCMIISKIFQHQTKALSIDVIWTKNHCVGSKGSWDMPKNNFALGHYIENSTHPKAPLGGSEIFFFRSDHHSKIDWAHFCCFQLILPFCHRTRSSVFSETLC